MIDALLERIYSEGQSNDQAATERSQMMFNITPSTGQFLNIMIEDAEPKRILEIGTSNGYSTIWLARAARQVGATIDSVDINPSKHTAAASYLGEAGFTDIVTLHTGDAGAFLSDCNQQSYDFVFLDSDRTRYVQWLADLFAAMTFGTLVVDNATSHPQELTDFFGLIDRRADLQSLVLPIGKGQLVVRATRDNSVFQIEG